MRMMTSNEVWVAPLAGAWIEILYNSRLIVFPPVAPLAGAWIEILHPYRRRVCSRVAPLAGAWIEMFATAAQH